MARRSSPESAENYRSSQADLMRAKRDAARIVVIPPCADKARRDGFEADDIAWLMWYFAPESECEDPFTYEFVEQQRTMIFAIRSAIIEGGDQAIAASRGEGKTTLFERMLLKYTLMGRIKFSVLFAATGSAAEDSLESIKVAVENNLRLRADYPEVCVPVEALENTPNRAHYQKVNGCRHDNGQPFEAASSKFSWCGQEIVFPRVPGSPSSGAIIATRGLDSAVRGVKKRGKRVDVACIDDPDTEETARSEEQAKKIEERIDGAIAGLGSQRRRVARIMLTTLQSRICVSYKFCDAVQKPSWKGRRFRFLLKPPDRLDLWDEYTQLRNADWDNERKGEPTAHAHEFYVANRDAMDAGAVVANPNRYTQGELSALQFYYNEVARIGPVRVATEYDNDPPEETGPVESGINPRLVQRQLSGKKQGEVPEGCTVLVHGVDVGKWWLHWVVRAFKPDGTGYTIDYGRQNVYGTKSGSEEGLDRAIRSEILRRVAEFREQPYAQQFRESLTLVDAGYRTEAVYDACQAAGMGVMPIMGFGKSAGCVKISWEEVSKRSADKMPICDGAFRTRKGNDQKFWLVCALADKWKAWEHDRWMTAQDKPGCMWLWGERSEGNRLSADEREHGHYAQHICAEVEVEDTVKGALVRKWKSKQTENHWLDASCYADVAAVMKGIRVLTATAVEAPKRRSLAEMAAKARGR